MAARIRRDVSTAARMSASTSATYGTARLATTQATGATTSLSATDGLRDCSGLRHRGGMSSTTLSVAPAARVPSTSRTAELKVVV